jgi:polysaccharide export outer membrane protein
MERDPISNKRHAFVASHSYERNRPLAHDRPIRGHLRVFGAPSRFRRSALLGLAACVIACSAGRFRYDRLSEKRDGVALRDLEDLLEEGSRPTPLGAEDLKVEQVDYEFSHEKDEYRLGKNDVLNIFVMGHPEMSSQRVNLGEISGTTIRKDGKVHMPVIGTLPAEGLTLTQFEDKLRERSAQFIVEPQVSVEILSYESQKFFILGQVPQPGAFPVDGDTTLLEALGMAGGVPPDADLESATVVRKGELLPINVADIMRRGDVSRNVFMQAGDLVYIPDNVAKNVYVLGEVQAPTVVPIERDFVSLAQALATAGGPTPARARRELAVIRGGYAKPVVYLLDLDKAMLVDHEIKLRPGDRVVVAPTGLSTASRYMQQILPFLQGLQAAGIAAQGGTNLATQAAAANSD